MRSTYLFNKDWLFLPDKADEHTEDDQFERVMLPHTNKILPHHNFDDAEYEFVSTYRKTFSLPEPLNGRRLFLDFDGAMLAATVMVNGHTFEEHRGGYTPFSFEITDHVDEDGENQVIVHLDSTERPDIPPFGGVVDYLAFGGIYRDVHLRYVEPLFIENVFVKPQGVLSNSKWLDIDVYINNKTVEFGEATLAIKLADSRGEGIKSTTETTSVQSSLPVANVRLDDLSAIDLWSLDNPVLYHLEVTLLRDDEIIDEYHVRFGFREAEFRDDGFFLNGELVKLMGLNRHQTFPYFGAAAPARLQEKDAEIVKYELGCNIVRTSHYPQSTYFLDRCDEIGLLVFEEIPGWQHIGDEDWKSVSMRDVQAMIRRDWNHPSIVIWGVRINESLDDTEFYKATNACARDIDPTRQTGGVRFWQHSEFLEDVYTFNDFSNSVQDPVQTPYLVTEFNGHMFPTKTFDGEERRVEHALRHARIQDKQMGMEKVTGAIGWCAFDYNTHKEFGSGDRICYHGVMDIFRLPKYAAHFYGSQIDPSVRVVLQAATAWTMGDRSEGGNNPLYVFSNVDELEVYMGDALHGKYQPARDEFPNLPHPPFKVEMDITWGERFKNLRIVGFVDGKQVAQQEYPINSQPRKLVLKADDDQLRADGMDMTRIVFKITDEFGNTLPYSTSVVSFDIDGPAQLIGENPFPLVGGQAALYLRARTEPSKVTVKARTARLAPAEITVQLMEAEDNGI